jgi:hypothetical protein
VVSSILPQRPHVEERQLPLASVCIAASVMVHWDCQYQAFCLVHLFNIMDENADQDVALVPRTLFSIWNLEAKRPSFLPVNP